jgi:hypothetical protein
MVFLQTVCRAPWKGDQPVAKPLPTQKNTKAEEMHADFLVSSWIRTYDPNFQAGVGKKSHIVVLNVVGPTIECKYVLSHADFFTGCSYELILIYFQRAISVFSPLFLLQTFFAQLLSSSSIFSYFISNRIFDSTFQGCPPPPPLARTKPYSLS